METVGFYSSNDEQIFPCKSQFAKTQKKKDVNQRSYISKAKPSDNFYQTTSLQTGIFLQQHLRLHDHFPSYPPFSSPQQLQQQQQQQQPPLLPLPLPHTRIRNPDHHHPRVRSLSCQPTNRKTSLTPKKSKLQPFPTIPKNMKPTAKDIEDQVTKVYNSSISGRSTSTDHIKLMKDADQEVAVHHDFPGSVAFTLSPPPSSLPLPTFSLRPKLSCNVMGAAGFDAGATDNLQRLLRLR